MSFALIEIEATAKKAARGAGYSWGMAEEAAWATRWLCANGIDGVNVLATLLSHVAGAELGGMAPSTLRGDWQATGGAVCPLAAGTALSDAVTYWAENGKRLENVIAPGLLLPFAAASARQLGATLTVDWTGGVSVTDGFATSLTLRNDTGLVATAGQVRVAIGGALGVPLPARTRATPCGADWATLNRFAQKTYAPNNEESRASGAGAGLTDND